MQKNTVEHKHQEEELDLSFIGIEGREDFIGQKKDRIDVLF